jgi:hypothetical protein
MFNKDPRPKSQISNLKNPACGRQDLHYIPAWNLELEIWNLRLNECGNLPFFRINKK